MTLRCNIAKLRMQDCCVRAGRKLPDIDKSKEKKGLLEKD